MYIGFQTFFSLFLWLPVFYEFQKHIGITDTQYFNIQSIYYLSFCFLEIPTGWIADRWGYKRSIVCGALLMVMANTLPVTCQSFYGILAHFIVLAASRSMISGAANAWLFEHLKILERTKEYKVIEGKGRAYGLIAKIACWPFVGVLMNWYIPLPYLITAFFSLVALLIALKLPGLKTGQQIMFQQMGEKKHRTPQIKIFIRALTASPLLAFLIIQGVAIFVMGRLQITFYQPLLVERSWTTVSLGTIMAVMTLFEAAGSFTPRWLDKIGLKDIHGLFLCTSLMALSFIMVCFSGQYGAVAGFCLFCFFIGVVSPIQQQLVNEAITDSRYRATLLSMESLVQRLLSAWVIAVMGGFVSAGRTTLFLTAFSMIVVLTVIIFYPLTRRCYKRNLSLNNTST
ncbi:MAG: MFS transporter [Deltaproteobacteria bacterium]|nr:MFS transporter [Deltaproteobacteria bacterium]